MRPRAGRRLPRPPTRTNERAGTPEDGRTLCSPERPADAPSVLRSRRHGPVPTGAVGGSQVMGRGFGEGGQRSGAIPRGPAAAWGRSASGAPGTTACTAKRVPMLPWTRPLIGTPLPPRRADVGVGRKHRLDVCACEHERERDADRHDQRTDHVGIPRGRSARALSRPRRRAPRRRLCPVRRSSLASARARRGHPHLLAGQKGEQVPRATHVTSPSGIGAAPSRVSSRILPVSSALAAPGFGTWFL